MGGELRHHAHRLLCFVNLTNPHPFTLGVQALNLATQATTFVATHRAMGSFSSWRHGLGGRRNRARALQHTARAHRPVVVVFHVQPGLRQRHKVLRRPARHAAATSVFASRSDIVAALFYGGNRPYGETVAIDLNTRTIKARMNSSLCYHLFAATADEVLCAAGTADQHRGAAHPKPAEAGDDDRRVR